MNENENKFTCSACDKIFLSVHSLSGHKRVHSVNHANSLIKMGRTLTEKAKVRYLENPRKCKQCDKCISYEKVLSNCYAKFCSSACAAIVNNKLRGLRSAETKLAISSTLKRKGKKLPFYERVNKREAKTYYENAVSGPFTIIHYCSCKHCNVKFISRSARRYCMDHAELYLDKGRNLYEFTFNPFKFADIFSNDFLENLKLKGFWSPSNKKGVTRDHRVSVNEAIKNKYDVFYIKHPINCELMGWEENNRKNTRSSMTYESLVSKVDEYEAVRLVKTKDILIAG